MQALVIPEAGKPAVLTEIPTPLVGRQDVLVRVQASAVTGFDRLIATGALEEFMPHHYPITVGREFTGTITAVGAEVDGYQVGDAVMGMITGSDLHEGAVAEYVAVHADRHLAHRPANLTPVAAASVAMSAQVALAALEHIDPQAGQHVLIVGASGGVGMYALQLAAARGAHIVATGRPGDEDILRAMGAGEVVDYEHDLPGTLERMRPQGFDALIDVATLDPGAFTTLSARVRDGGRAACSTMLADPLALAERDISAVNVMVDLAPGQPLQHITAMLTDGSLRPLPTHATALAHAEHVIAQLPHRHRPGRHVITF